ncbi:DAAF3 factor, partial [Tricholaema leucomelas]|nr:DAAF3 factor [Tricholaema leucomelas]
PVAVPESRGWEHRLRRRLGTRYDARAAVADWDLRMELHSRGATTVASGEFGLWRENGVAFASRDGDGDVPNPTLQSSYRPRAVSLGGGGAGGGGGGGGGGVRVGVPGRRRGGGLTVPFSPPPQTATDISLANVTATLREMLTGTPHGDPPVDRDPPCGDSSPLGECRPPPPTSIPGSGFSPCRPLPGVPFPVSPSRCPPSPDPLTVPAGPLLPLPVRIRFLPLGSSRCPPPRLAGTFRLLLLGWR